MFCWHIWTKWKDDEIKYSYLYHVDGVPGSRTMMQKKRCLKCGKIKHRKDWCETDYSGAK